MKSPRERAAKNRFEIEDDIPPPAGRGSGERIEIKNTMSQMEKGQSSRFEMPGKDSTGLQSSIGKIASKLKPKRFVTKQDPDGIGCRVWRIE